MALEIKWSKRADKKFDKIIVYLLEEWGDLTSQTFIQKVFSFIDTLPEFPDIGTIENQKKGIRGFTIVKQINIFYRISGDTIVILDFFDNRQNPNKKRF
jgi:plasmid stabilization system protein ParE